MDCQDEAIKADNYASMSSISFVVKKTIKVPQLDNMSNIACRANLDEHESIKQNAAIKATKSSHDP